MKRKAVAHQRSAYAGTARYGINKQGLHVPVVDQHEGQRKIARIRGNAKWRVREKAAHQLVDGDPILRRQKIMRRINCAPPDFNNAVGLFGAGRSDRNHGVPMRAFAHGGKCVLAQMMSVTSRSIHANMSRNTREIFMRSILTAALLMAALPASAETLIVGNKGEDTVSFIDLASGKEQARVASGANPHEVALSPDGKLAAVVNYGGSAIDVYAVPGGKRVATWDISPNARPHGLLWLPDGRLVATAEGSKTLVVIDGASGRVLQSIATDAEGSHMVAVHPKRARAYTANLKSGNVSVIDLGTGRTVGHLAAGREAEGISITPDGKQVWISSRGSNEVHVYDTETEKLVRRIETGPFPLRIAISPDGTEAVTSNLSAGELGVYSVKTGKLVRTVPVSGKGEAMQVTILFRPDGKRLYVAETGTNTVAEVEWPSGKVLRRFPVGVNGDGLGWSPVGAE